MKSGMRKRKRYTICEWQLQAKQSTAEVAYSSFCFHCRACGLSFFYCRCFEIGAVRLKHTKSHSYAVCSFRQMRCFNKMILKYAMPLQASAEHAIHYILYKLQRRYIHQPMLPVHRFVLFPFAYVIPLSLSILRKVHFKISRTLNRFQRTL